MLNASKLTTQSYQVSNANLVNRKRKANKQPKASKLANKASKQATQSYQVSKAKLAS